MRYSVETIRTETSWYRDKETQRRINEGYVSDQIMEHARKGNDSCVIWRYSLPFYCSPEEFAEMAIELRNEDGFGAEINDKPMVHMTISWGLP